MKKLICILFLALTLRSILYFISNQSMDTDEAEILIAGRYLWKERDFKIFLWIGYHWELMSSYFYSALDLCHNALPKLGSIILSLLDILLVFKITKKHSDEKVAHLAAFFLALSPWHLHYSTITATVNLPLTLALSFFYWQPSNIFLRLIWHSLGLLSYPAYRLYYLFDGLMLWHKKNIKLIMVNAGALLLCAAIIILAGQNLSLFFLRGGHNIVSGWNAMATNIGGFLVAPWITPMPYFSIVANDFFVADYTHYALVKNLVTTPLGDVVSVFFLLALALLVRHKKWHFSLWFFLIAVISLSFMGPSLARMYFLIPLYVIYAAASFNHIIISRQRNILQYFLLSICFISPLTYLYSRYDKIKNETVFHHSYFSVLKKFPTVPITIITGPGNRVWDYLESSKRLPADASVVAAHFPQEYLPQILRSYKNSDGIQWFYLHDFDPEVDVINEGSTYVKDRRWLRDYLFRHTKVIESHELFDKDVRLGELLKIIWKN